MKNRVSKSVIIVVAVLLLFLGVFGFLNYPVYHQAVKEIDSLSALRDELGENDATKNLIIVDPGAFDGETQSQTLRMNGRSLLAKPVGYCITWTKTEKETYDTSWSVIGTIPNPNDTFDGTSYRNTPVELKIYRDLPQNRLLALHLLCGEYVYSIDASFDTTGLSEQETTEREAALQEILYAVADRIIDGAG